MTCTYPATMSEIQQELGPGETVLWLGQPNPSVVFHASDLYAIPFSLVWGGFMLFWEAAACGLVGRGKNQPGGGWWFGALFGIPMVLVGQYLIWGRFLYAAWLKRRTYYAITNQRAIVVQRAWQRKVCATYIDALPTFTKRVSGSRGTGTLRLGPPSERRGRQTPAWDALAVGAVPVFVDIDDVDSVCQLVMGMRAKVSSTAIG